MKQLNIRPLYAGYINEDDFDPLSTTDVKFKYRKLDFEHATYLKKRMQNMHTDPNFDLDDFNFHEALYSQKIYQCKLTDEEKYAWLISMDWDLNQKILPIYHPIYH